MRWKKRLLLALAVFFTAAILLAAAGIYLYKHAPSWYAPRTMSEDQRLQASRSAEDKMIRTYNWASRQARATSQPTATTVTFTTDEINAFFEKWEILSDPHWQAFVSDPMLVVHDHQLVLGGLFKPLNTIISLHFQPSLDETGRLHLHLQRIMGGQLPLPMTFFNHQRQIILDGVRPRLAQWQHQAHIDRQGANDAMIAAAMTQLFLTVFSDDPAEPVIFLPANDQRAMPARLTDIKIENSSITLRVEPMSQAEREAFLARVRGWSSLGTN